MTQLSDDCFAFGGKLQTLDAALAQIELSVTPIDQHEQVPLNLAVGRIAAQDVVATRAVPPHNNSAVDGYAVAHSHLSADGKTTLRISNRLAAGQSGVNMQAEAGQTLRIFTGAMVPKGYDTIFMQEDVEVLNKDEVSVPNGLQKGANLRLAGEDVDVGHKLVTKGQVLRPQEIGLLAAQGIETVQVIRPLRVGVLSTGSELVNQRPADGQVFDSNQTMLVSALNRAGVVATGLGIVPDDLAETKAFLKQQAADYDVLVSTGGVSAGEEDHVKAAVESVGRLNFWRIALKPGRPVALGEIGACVFVGLPGNPVAAMVTLIAVLQPLIKQLQGALHIRHRPIKAVLTHALKKKASRREFIRVSEVGYDEEGRLLVTQHPAKGAGILRSLQGSDGLLILNDDVTDVQGGSAVFDYLRYSEVMGGLS